MVRCLFVVGWVVVVNLGFGYDCLGLPAVGCVVVLVKLCLSELLLCRYSHVRVLCL